MEGDLFHEVEVEVEAVIVSTIAIPIPLHESDMFMPTTMVVAATTTIPTTSITTNTHPNDSTMIPTIDTEIMAMREAALTIAIITTIRAVATTITTTIVFMEMV